MRDRKNLTKSLHSVSAVTAVALHLHRTELTTARAKRCVDEALQLLGQPGVSEWAEDDDTVLRCIAAVKKAMGEK